jgi:hypothetical protein
LMQALRVALEISQARHARCINTGPTRLKEKTSALHSTR